MGNEKVLLCVMRKTVGRTWLKARLLGFFSGGRDGDLKVPDPSTGPITETADGSTRDSVSLILVSVSNFLASLFSFFNL